MRCASPASPKPAASRRWPSMGAPAPAPTPATPNTTPSPQSRRSVNIPVIANGDITTPEKAKYVLGSHRRGCGDDRARGAGPPVAVPRNRAFPARPASICRRRRWARSIACCCDHVHELYEFYGEHTGLRVARKHISWYTKGLSGSAHFRHHMNQLETPDEQLAAVDDFFAEQSQRGRKAALHRGTGGMTDLVVNENDMARYVRKALKEYFRDLDGEDPCCGCTTW